MFQHDPNKNKSYKLDRVGAILSLNTALLVEVSPALRSAQIKWDQELIHLFFYYDGEVSEEDHESAERVATEVIASYPEHQLEIDILRWDYPKPIPKVGELVYYRREPGFIRKQQDPFLHLNEIDPKFLLRIKVILSMIDALLGEVSPALRSATVSWDEKKIHLYFYYDGEISDEDKKSAERIRTKVSSNFPEYQLNVQVIRWDYPKWFPEGAFETVYRKREPNPERQ